MKCLARKRLRNHMDATNSRRADSEVAEEVAAVVEEVSPKEVELDLKLVMLIKSQDIKGREQTLRVVKNLKKRAKSIMIKKPTVKLVKLMKTPITIVISMDQDLNMKELL